MPDAQPKVKATRRYYSGTTTDQQTGKVNAYTSNTPTANPNEQQYMEDTYDDGSVATYLFDPQTNQWTQTGFKPGRAAAAGSPTAQQNADASTARAAASQQRAEAATTSAQAAQTRAATQSTYDQSRAETGQQNADTRAAAERARADYLQTMGDRYAFQARAQAYSAQLNQQVALGTLDMRQKQALLDAYKAEAEATQNAQRLAIEQQNANTTAGQLGVSRGALGVNQENADTNREQVIQQASNNAVDQTLRLMSQYMKVGPGFGAQFAAGVNTLSRGGGPMTVTPDAFMGAPVPDLAAIRTAAVDDAIGRLKGTLGLSSPATQAAVNATSVPGPVAPVPVGPAPSPPPAVTAAQIGAAVGPPPQPPALAPAAAVPPYLGPTGAGSVGGAGNVAS